VATPAFGSIPEPTHCYCSHHRFQGAQAVAPFRSRATGPHTPSHIQPCVAATLECHSTIGRGDNQPLPTETLASLSLSKALTSTASARWQKHSLLPPD